MPPGKRSAVPKAKAQDYQYPSAGRVARMAWRNCVRLYAAKHADYPRWETQSKLRPEELQSH